MVDLTPAGTDRPVHPSQRLPDRERGAGEAFGWPGAEGGGTGEEPEKLPQW